METVERAQVFAALGDPIRLGIVEDLLLSDQSPHVLAERYGLASNLLTHHLAVLEAAGLIDRSVSSGDRRRRYLRLRQQGLDGIRLQAPKVDRPVLFVCTHNSARSQLAEALWGQSGISPAASAGTRPSEQVHSGAMAAGDRAGLDLTGQEPRILDPAGIGNAQVVTVCDQAHEEIEDIIPHWHWSTPDPVGDPTEDAFDVALAKLRSRIENITGDTE